jgi:cyclic beta-1,2-glucan synthetase
LWASAITLRIILVENLRRLAELIAARLGARKLADELADRLLEFEGGGGGVDELRRLLSATPWSTAFAVQLAQRLRDRDPKITPALEWLNQRLADEHTSIDEIVRKEVRRQSETNVTVRNIITSMRLVSTINWSEWFESVSVIDRILRQHTAFAAMDFTTRDNYRRAIEELSSRSAFSESEVAEHAVACAKRASVERDGAHAARRGDPGFYLVAEGRAEFERSLNYHVSLRTRFLRVPVGAGIRGYLGLMSAAAAIVLGIALAALAQEGVGGWMIVLFAIVGAVPASDVAIAIVNRAVAYQVGAVLLPGLELREGVPHDLRTIVVVPSMLTSSVEAVRLVEQVEVHYLSNRDDNLHFALLTDWRDAATEHAPDDASLLAGAVAGIARLNEKYGPANAGPRFLLLHRRRLWNDAQGKWMGWERKRGKLHELNRVIAGARDTSFVATGEELNKFPADVRFVITLDADTRLPIDGARRLIGKLAHPLNRPVIDRQAGRVVTGHGILQPRVTPSLPIGREGSLYQRTFSGPNGLDPYAFAVSDVYQDLFEEGSYVGKGIYQVGAFEAATEGQVPENAILSHDLLEGILARAGLATDIEVVEEFPSRYEVAAARQHRWTRGDWQLLPWIFGFGRKGRNARGLPVIGRWKLFDNLRRSLSAPAALLALLLGWLLPFEAAAVWTGFVVLTLLVPPALPVLTGLWLRQPGISASQHLRDLGEDLKLALLQFAFLVTFLAHQAWTMLDAVGRTLSRLFIHKRRMLEWVTAAQVADASASNRTRLLLQLFGSVSFAALVAVMVTVGEQTWMLATPFLMVWALSPLIADWASLPPPAAGELNIDPKNIALLRSVGRRTWTYFEAFVDEANNHLPPDNFQESPTPILARRTSPTNIGLYLLSIVAARDFGWLGTVTAVERLEATFASMSKLELFRGHFFNWYDTRDLRALAPRYVSSVDSGNLAGHLLALANACDEMAAAPIISPLWKAGLSDALGLVGEAVSKLRQDGRAADDLLAHLQASSDACARAIEANGDQTSEAADGLAKLVRCGAALNESVTAIVEEGRVDTESADEARAAARSFCASVAAHVHDLDALAPWVGAMASEPRFAEVRERFALTEAVPTLAELPELCEAWLLDLRSSCANEITGELAAKRQVFIESVERSAETARHLMARIASVAAQARAMFAQMEFGFLFDDARQLLSIGYRTEDATLDSNFYDLLASEARLASFVAIAKGDVPASHWFRLGRTLTPIDGGAGLISWSGSMFEYLMPSLVMRAPTGSLLERTNRLVVRRQREYGAKLHTPWGMSESQYNGRDLEHTYQYSSFGVPDLGYKRGLAENTVIAPYATALAAMVAPGAAAANFTHMSEIGARGRYGWYEALDYTHTRVPKGQTVAIVRAFMAHHQAMSIVAIADALHGGAMRTRFHDEPMVKSVELLLQERMPRAAAVARPPPERTSEPAQSEDTAPTAERRFTTVHSLTPRTQTLSNGRYSVMLTATGSGYSRWREIDVTRWREDPTCDNSGSYIFLRDVADGRVWSPTYQPSAIEPDDYEVVFAEDRVDFFRRDGEIATKLEVGVSAEHDAEVRRVSITNHGPRVCEVEITSYAEIALSRRADDTAHPAFAKMFVETEFVADLSAVLAMRRRRSDDDPHIWAAHLAVVEGQAFGDVQFETDRARFLGRGRTTRTAAAIRDGWPLSNTSGAVLDPVFSLRRRVRIGPGATARVAFWTIIAESREDVLALADKHHDAAAFERAITLAWTQAQIQLHHLGVTPDEAHLFQRLANHVHYSNAALRPAPEVLKNGAARASTLWAHGVSGDAPIVLVRVEGDGDDLLLVRQLLRAHEYWRLKQIAVDLVILNERAASYAQDFQQALDALVRTSRVSPSIVSETALGGVRLLRADLISREVDGLLQSAARIVIRGDSGSLGEQVARARDGVAVAPVRAKPVVENTRRSGQASPPREELTFANGFGGFTQDGREYVVTLQEQACTPMPWINVIANKDFGFLASAEGGGCTWSRNSQQNRITPWSNDPVGDAPGEVFYIRDDDTGELWTATALPIRDISAIYVARHGQGYSKFETAAHGIKLELLQYVPANDSLKISQLKITNESARRRRLTITAYVEWVLGTSRAASAPHIITDIDAHTGAVFAQNRWSNDFGERVAFADWREMATGWSGDRTEFLGRDGRLDAPAGLAAGAKLSNRVGAGMDPCAALQTTLSLDVSASKELVFFLGQAGSPAEARSLIDQYRSADLGAVLEEVASQWDAVLGAVQVHTPDRSLDVLMNRWLLYQTLSCRIWARAGFYQSSGAYGFRDQLQDVMALCVARPDVAREHLLRAASRQFIEGDVQHWWLPERGSGIRTRISDDKVWLAYVTAHYVRTTGDVSVLAERVSFLRGPVLREEQRDAFFEPSVSEDRASLFDHCALALEQSLSVGPHGLPLMGTGDWNDGMDRVGEGGSGESVWLAWFLYSTLIEFSAIAEARGAGDHAVKWRKHAFALAEAAERQAWDGDWYRRAFFDNGTPLGSVINTECRIDAIAQSWSVISGAADNARATRAMAALDKYLIKRDDGLALLLTPPFENATPDPGYIRGYPAGIRENGGQYTHAAAWTAQAFAMLGDGDKAVEILSLINPINHTGNSAGVHRYKAEPYAVCADVYSTSPHVGRGGWSWYTGSAAWTYRVALERVLGFRKQGDHLLIDPCIPQHWPGFTIGFRHRSATYEITVENPLGVCRGILAAKLDGELLAKRPLLIALLDDGASHQLRVVLGG